MRRFADILTGLLLIIGAAALIYLFVDSLKAENNYPTTGYTWIDIDGDGVEECINDLK